MSADVSTGYLFDNKTKHIDKYQVNLKFQKHYSVFVGNKYHGYN